MVSDADELTEDYTCAVCVQDSGSYPVSLSECAAAIRSMAHILHSCAS